MPLFALISGYLFFWSMRRKGLVLFKKQILSLLVPIAVWKGLETLARGVVSTFRGTLNITDLLLEYFSALPDAFWFLWAMFWCSMVVLIVEKALHGKWWIYLVLLVSMLFIPSVHNIHLYVYMYPYFVVGFLIHKRNILDGKEWPLKRYTILCGALIVTFAILFIFYDRSSFVYTTKISLLRADNAATQLGINLYRWLIGFIGSSMVILIVKMIYERCSKSIFIKVGTALGQSSLGIYILNSYTNTYILPMMTAWAMPNIVIWMTETAVSMAIYFLCVWVIRKISIANRLLLGGRSSGKGI